MTQIKHKNLKATSRVKSSLGLPLFIFVGFLSFALIAPLVALIARGLSSGGLVKFWETLTDSYHLDKLQWSLSSALITVLLCSVLGLPVAWMLARFRFMGKTLILRVLLLPFVVPTPVAGMGLLALFGPKGMTGLHLQETATLVIIGNLFYNFALAVRFFYGGILRIDRRLLEAARILAGTKGMFKILLPLLLPSVGAASSLIFLYSFTSFGLPLLLGGEKFATLEVDIYTLVSYQLELNAASALVVLQLLITLAATLLYARFGRQFATLRNPLPLEAKPARTWLERLGLGLCLAFILGLSLAPLLAVVLRSFWGSDGFTLRFYAGLLSSDANTSFALALRNSLFFGLGTLVFSLVMGLLAALSIFSATGKLRHILDASSLLPLMVSPISVSVGYLLLYPGLNAGLVLMFSAYTLLAYPLVTRAILPALRSISPHVLEAGRMLGLNSRQMFWRITFPLLKPALRTGSAFALATALGEFAATLVLQRPEWGSLTLGIYEKLGRPGAQNLGEAMALSSVLLLLTVLCFSAIDTRGEVG